LVCFERIRKKEREKKRKHPLVAVYGFLVGSWPVSPDHHSPPAYNNIQPDAPDFDPEGNTALHSTCGTHTFQSLCQNSNNTSYQFKENCQIFGYT